MQKHSFLLLLLFLPLITVAQPINPKGNLFVIGGGHRTEAINRQMIQTANLDKKDYIVVLPMASSEPDSAYYYFKTSIDTICSNAIVNLNFTPNNVNNTSMLDSLRRAKLIFIAGGDQSRFMKVVFNTPVYKAVHEAYNNGATVAGTSAGAAVMSKHMITGNQLIGDTAYRATFNKLVYNNIEFEEGLGLLDSIIIDQHFIKRSRYNRLFSALAQYPNYTCVGIDESTAIIVHSHAIKITGESEVIVLSHPQQLRITDKGLIKLKDADISIYTAGDSFQY